MRNFLIILCILFLSCASYAKSYYSVDMRAENAPAMVTQATLNDLVKNLIKPYSQEEDKARVLLAWIVKNIDYDNYRYSQMVETLKHPNSVKDRSVPDNDILTTHLGICATIADLYVQMAHLAGLEARTVSGFAGHNLTKTTYTDNPHAWVIVTIDGEEKFIDPTWAIQGGEQNATTNITKNSAYMAELRRREKRKFYPQKNRTVDETWFLTKPQYMIKTHFPDNPDDQLLKRPVSLSSFLLKSRN